MQKKTDDLPVAIIICLTRLFENLQPTSKYYKSFYWIAMSLTQIHDAKLFTACLPLLEAVIKGLDQAGSFRGIIF